MRRKQRGPEWVAEVDHDRAQHLLGNTYRRLQLLAGASSALGAVFVVLFFLVQRRILAEPSTVRLGALTLAALACFLNAFMYRRSMKRQYAHFSGRELPEQLMRATPAGLEVWARRDQQPVRFTWPELTVTVAEKSGHRFLRFSTEPPLTAARLDGLGMAPEVARTAVAQNFIQVAAALMVPTVEEMTEALTELSQGAVTIKS